MFDACAKKTYAIGSSANWAYLFQNLFFRRGSFTQPVTRVLIYISIKEKNLDMYGNTCDSVVFEYTQLD